MARHRFIYRPSLFDKFVMPPFAVGKGLLKEGDIVYKGESHHRQCYIYNQEGKLLGMVFKSSLEKIN